MIRKGIIITRDGWRILGGPGSGNWGHIGIPGYRGGSQAGSGGAFARPENYMDKHAASDPVKKGKSLAEELDGKHWTSSDGKQQRVYFNNEQKVAKVVGLELKHYNTGNIKQAFLNGEEISNARARKIMSAIHGSYYNVTKDELVTDSQRFQDWYDKKYKL